MHRLTKGKIKYETVKTIFADFATWKKFDEGSTLAKKVMILCLENYFGKLEDFTVERIEWLWVNRMNDLENR